MPPLSGSLKRLIPLTFALVMAGVAMLLVHNYIQQKEVVLERERKRLLANYQEPVEVVVAAKDLPEGHAIESSNLTLASVPEKFIQPYAVRSANQVLGLVTVAPIAEGEQMLVNKLRRPEAAPKDATLSALTPKGKRAVTIAVDAITGVGGFVRPGDNVDILWTIQLPQASGGQGQQVVTMMLFQEVPILAVGQETAGRGKQRTESGQEYTVTLALTPQETSFLLFAREQGRIQLSLRSRGDSGPVAVAPANLNTLMETVLGVQASAAKPPRQVEVYKGLKRDVVQLPEGQ